jgi:hypothetical protein
MEKLKKRMGVHNYFFHISCFAGSLHRKRLAANGLRRGRYFQEKRRYSYGRNTRRQQSCENGGVKLNIRNVKLKIRDQARPITDGMGQKYGGGLRSKVKNEKFKILRENGSAFASVCAPLVAASSCAKRCWLLVGMQPPFPFLRAGSPAGRCNSAKRLKRVVKKVEKGRKPGSKG